MSISLIRTVAVELGVSILVATRLAATASKRYKRFRIPKKRGGFRDVAQPAREVKALQRAIIRQLSPHLPIHTAATAYRRGVSILDNATQHAEARYLLKLDFTSFFPSISAGDIQQHLSRHISDIDDSEIAFVNASCLWRLRQGAPHGLCIGAPSSPLLSNSVLFEFDETVWRKSEELGAVYTRYSDDVSLSSERPGVLRVLEAYVKEVVLRITYPRLSFNEPKRVSASRGTLMRVTGLTLANDGRVTVGRLRKRGVRAGVQAFLTDALDDDRVRQLRGELAFVLSVEPSFRHVLLNSYGARVAELFPSIGD